MSHPSEVLLVCGTRPELIKLGEIARPRAPFGDYFWDPRRDTAGDCLLDDAAVRAAVSEPGRLWIVLAVPEYCVATEPVIEAIDRAGRTVVERIDLDGPSALLLVEQQQGRRPCSTRRWGGRASRCRGCVSAACRTDRPSGGRGS